MALKLYDILKVLNGHFTPDSTGFFDYCVNTLDSHSSFLRSRFCKREEPLKDYEINPDINRVLCAFDNPFDISSTEALKQGLLLLRPGSCCLPSCPEKQQQDHRFHQHQQIDKQSESVQCWNQVQQSFL